MVHPADGSPGPLAVTYGAGRWVGVGKWGGTMVYSDDLQVWHEVSTPVSESLISVSFGAGRFVALGHLGTIIVSEDGSVWRVAYVHANRAFLRDLVWGGGRFVAVGIYGTTLASEDGLNWVRTASPPTQSWDKVAYGPPGFVVIGGSATIFSQDGLHWEEVANPAPGGKPRWDDDRFISIGIPPRGGYSCLTQSPDGRQWTASCNTGLDGAYVPFQANGHMYAFGCSQSQNGALYKGNGCVPVIASASPDTGPIEGGTVVTIRGANLGDATSVYVGDTPAASFVVDSEGQITLITPPHSIGPGDISVSTPNGTSMPMATDPFAFGTRPQILGIKALSAPFRLKISGTNFHKGCSVTINGVNVLSSAWKNSQSITLKGGMALKGMVPVGVPVEVVVSNDDDRLNSHRFAYTR